MQFAIFFICTNHLIPVGINNRYGHPNKEVLNNLDNSNIYRTDLGEHMCLFGGAVPYMYFNKESNREHSDIDILVDGEFINVIRDLAKQNNIYIPELDSLNLELDDDYGLKVYVDGVYVEFEPMSIEDGQLVRKSFSPKRELAGVEMIPFQDLVDLIVEIDLNGIKSYCQSPELIKAEKEQYKREKDLLDIEFIDSQGISMDSYENLRNKKTL